MWGIYTTMSIIRCIKSSVPRNLKGVNCRGKLFMILSLLNRRVRLRLWKMRKVCLGMRECVDENDAMEEDGGDEMMTE
jgi:hypothetical protein